MTQLGWENNYVMEGGLNYWAEVIMNPIPPAQTSPDEEIARYLFRKAASSALSTGATTDTSASTAPLAKPPIIKRPIVITSYSIHYTKLYDEGKRGSQYYRKATWDEALDKVAEGMKKIAQEHSYNFV